MKESILETEVAPAVWAAIRAEWLVVITGALAPDVIWQAGWFDPAAEEIIRQGLERAQYKPKLPRGREREAAEAGRLQRVVARSRNGGVSLGPKERGLLLALAKLYRSVAGAYYVLRPLRDEVRTKWAGIEAKAREASDVELRRAAALVGQGIPEVISDFYLEPLYSLRRVNGERERLVRIRNVHGLVSEPARLPSAAFAQPAKFREWLLNTCAGAAWHTGERPLQMLHADFSSALSYRDVQEVPVRLYEEGSGCWFAADVVYDRTGRALYADEDGIVWVEGKGYRLGETDHEGQSFRHGEPRFALGKTAAGTVRTLYGEARVQALAAEPAVSGGGEGELERAALRFFFQDICTRLYETVGGYGGYLALGMCFLAAAGPEVYETFNMVPCLWVHGEPRQGKTSLVRWLMRIFGLRVESGIPLKDSTRVGLSIALQQYGYGQVWLEEYQADAPDWMVEKLKAVHDRSAGSKKTFDEGDRKLRAMAIVTGVATSTNAQLRSRFAHVQVSSSARQANHFDWFQAHCGELVLLGRFLMEHRAEYAALVVAKTREWLASAAMVEIKDERARLVHGAAYAGFYAMVALLESHGPEVLRGFREYLVGHCREALEEVDATVNVNQFWRLVCDAAKSDVFGMTVGERQRIMKVVPSQVLQVPLSPLQLQAGVEDARKAWTPERLYFQPGPLIAMLREYLRRQGRDLPLDRSDLRAQMKTRRYWVEPTGSRAGKGTHRIRFAGSTTEDCWCIELDLHELGRQEVSDDEFLASQMKDAERGEFWPSEQWVDPRRGDLFALVDALKSRKDEQ